jgi:hypothetical protein
VGFYINAAGERKPKRFNLGTDRTEAERRYHRLHDLFAELSGETWAGRTLAYAEQLAAGLSTTFQQPREDSKNFPYFFDDSRPENYAQNLEQEKRLFPSLDLVPNDPQRHADSVEAQRLEISKRIAQLQQELTAAWRTQSGGGDSPREDHRRDVARSTRCLIGRIQAACSKAAGRRRNAKYSEGSRADQTHQIAIARLHAD